MLYLFFLLTHKITTCAAALHVLPQQRITTQQCVLIKEIKMMLTRLHAHTLTHMQQMQQHPTDLKVLQGVACVCCVIATRLTRVCLCVRLMNV